MPFLRFIVENPHSEDNAERGAFGVAYRLRNDPNVNDADRRLLSEILEWFERNLRTPERFNRTRSKGYYRRSTKGISWFRDTAGEYVSRMHVIKQVLERYGYAVTVLHETRIGYVVYEDEVQAVAEPFFDTRTGPAR